jgi:hypothetical protein
MIVVTARICNCPPVTMARQVQVYLLCTQHRSESGRKGAAADRAGLTVLRGTLSIRPGC